MSVLDSMDAKPSRVIEIRDESVGLDAVVVVDHELFPSSAGGTRMIPDVTTDEVARLARAMTWKLAVARVPLAGAKAGIRFAGGDRAAILAAYFARIGEIEGFLTGPDMGTHPDDFVHSVPEGPPPLWTQSHDGMSMDDLAVGRGILGAARVALDRVGRPLEGAAVAIEGFGKAGAGTGKAMHEARARVVAISTIEGALVDPAGLDVPELLRLRREHGDRLVYEAGLEVRPREALFDVECDLLVPGARPDVITRESASTLRTGAIVPAANIPYAPGAVEALDEAGILALPDFVSNAGGVHLYEAPPCKENDPRACLDAVEQLVGEATGRVLDSAAATGSTPTDAALEVAREYLRTARA